MLSGLDGFNIVFTDHHSAIHQIVHVALRKPFTQLMETFECANLVSSNRQTFIIRGGMTTIGKEFVVNVPNLLVVFRILSGVDHIGATVNEPTGNNNSSLNVTNSVHLHFDSLVN